MQAAMAAKKAAMMARRRGEAAEAEDSCAEDDVGCRSVGRLLVVCWSSAH